MPAYSNNVKPVISLAPKGQLTLALYPASSNGAPIEKYMVIVQNTTKSMSRLKRESSSSSTTETCPHIAKYSYGEHQTSGYYVCAEIKASLFNLDDVIQFKLGNNKTSFKYHNPSLQSGTYDIWYYAVTKKLQGLRAQSCIKLASVKVPVLGWATEQPEIQYLYRSDTSGNFDSDNNFNIVPTSKVKTKDSDSNLTTYLVAIALAFVLVVGIVTGYAVFVQKKKNEKNGLPGKLQSKDSSNGGYSNNGMHNHHLHHTFESEVNTFDSNNEKVIVSNRIPQDSGNYSRIPGQISITEQSDMFDVKIFASDGRLDHSQSQHSTPVQ